MNIYELVSEHCFVSLASPCALLCVVKLVA